MILRQRDANSGWTSVADGTLEERRYLCQNWRGDLSVVLKSGGAMVEWAKYMSYGIPFGLPAADTDSDGDCDSTDVTQIQTWIDAPSYDVRADVDLDGDIDGDDATLAGTYNGTTNGWGVLSATAVANRISYAGYQQDINLTNLDHVRNRVLEVNLGRSTRRDPLGYVDGMSLYEYVGSSPISSNDPAGLDGGGVPRHTIQPGDMPDDRFRHFYGVDPPQSPFDPSINDGTSGTPVFPPCFEKRGNAYERCMCEYNWGYWKCYLGLKCTRARGTAKRLFPNDNDKRDTFRHCLWSCCLAQTVGYDFQHDVTDRHEEAHKGEYHPCQDAMDYFNNDVGLDCVNGNCITCCLDKIDGGSLVIDWRLPDRRICGQHGCSCAD